MSNSNLRIEQQESGPLSPEEFLKDETLGFFDTEDKIKCMLEYAGYRTVYSHNKHLTEFKLEVKRLKEEREDILKSLFSIRDMVGGTTWAVINKLIDQLNQNNEG